MNLLFFPQKKKKLEDIIFCLASIYYFHVNLKKKKTKQHAVAITKRKHQGLSGIGQHAKAVT